MPRNVLASKTNEELAMQYIIRLEDRSIPPTKLYSTTDLWDELKKRIGFNEADQMILEARSTLALLGED